MEKMNGVFTSGTWMLHSIVLMGRSQLGHVLFIINTHHYGAL